MSGQIASSPGRLAGTSGGLHGAWAGLAIGLLTFGAAFHNEIAAAINTWVTSTAYNHCFLIIPLAMFLLWDRRASLRGLTARPAPLAALFVLPLGVIWLAAERLGIMEGRQLAAVSIVEVLLFAMLGRSMWTAIAGPLLYLYFLVPFGEFLTPTLQSVTTWFVQIGLNMFGIPAYIDGNVIEIPEGTFFVAEACAGLRFLIASVAFGVLYALLLYRGTLRRAIFVGVSIIVPVVANGIRAIGIVALGHLLGSAQAAEADHILYGWIFFSIVILLLIAMGLLFRQDNRPEVRSEAPMKRGQKSARRGLIAGCAVAVLGSFGPVTAFGLNWAAASPALALKPLDLTPGCETVSSRIIPASENPWQTLVQRVNCAGTPMILELDLFSPRSTVSPINAEQRRLMRATGTDDVSIAPLTTRSGDAVGRWRVIEASHAAFVSAAALWVEGEPATPGGRMRLEMARTSLTGVSHVPAALVITPVADWQKVDPRTKEQLKFQIVGILQSHPELGDQVRSMARIGQ